MDYDTEINNLFGLFINEDSYFPMFQRLGINISKVNSSFRKSFENGVLFHPNEINPKPSKPEQKINRELRIELVNLIRGYLKKFDQQTYGEIYKLFQSVDRMRDTIRGSESLSQQIQFEILIKEVEDKVDEFTDSYLTLTKN
ncbi:hypothetical protein OAL99_02420 [Gammaproteobacteria bacterium]|nr:hypothetical protein [Gammaproteobacteria bacterium]